MSDKPAPASLDATAKLLKRLSAVPKAEVDAKLAAEQRRRSLSRRKRRSA